MLRFVVIDGHFEHVITTDADPVNLGLRGRVRFAFMCLFGFGCSAHIEILTRSSVGYFAALNLLARLRSAGAVRGKPLLQVDVAGYAAQPCRIRQTQTTTSSIRTGRLSTAAAGNGGGFKVRDAISTTGTRRASCWNAGFSGVSSVASRTMALGVVPSANALPTSSLDSIPSASIPRSRSSARTPARSIQSRATTKTTGILKKQYSIPK
jgi:hypothetical protein